MTPSVYTKHQKQLERRIVSQRHRKAHWKHRKAIWANDTHDKLREEVGQ